MDIGARIVTNRIPSGNTSGIPPCIGSSPRNNLAVILVYAAPFGPMLVLCMLTDMRICLSGIVVIRPVVGIPYRVVIASVGPGIHHTICSSRSDEIPVIRLIYINLIKRINISDMVVVIPESIVVDTHTSKAVQPSAPIVHMNIPDSADPSVIIVKDGKLCDLYNRPIVIVLYVRIVIKT